MPLAVHYIKSKESSISIFKNLAERKASTSYKIPEQVICYTHHFWSRPWKRLGARIPPKWFLGASGSEAEQSFANIHGEKTWNRDELKVAGRKFQVLQSFA
jgi:hypothetical protein